ncbi:MAG: PqqD family protein [Desulfuromonadaceae bacterium]|nr:PqqD family protein [Desulfuromonadaceae bacterium]
MVRALNLIATDLDDETILMSVEQGSYYGMEATARRIWELIETPTSVADLIDLLSQEYNVTPDICGPDIIAYLEELNAEGLIVVS